MSAAILFPLFEDISPAPRALPRPATHQRAARPSWEILWLPGFHPAPSATTTSCATAPAWLPHCHSSPCCSVRRLTLFPDLLAATCGCAVCTSRTSAWNRDCRHHPAPSAPTSGSSLGCGRRGPGLPARPRPGRGGGTFGIDEASQSPSAAPTTRCGSNPAREGPREWGADERARRRHQQRDLATGRVAAALTLSVVRQGDDMTDHAPRGLFEGCARCRTRAWDHVIRPVPMKRARPQERTVRGQEYAAETRREEWEHHPETPRRGISREAGPGFAHVDAGVEIAPSCDVGAGGSSSPTWSPGHLWREAPASLAGLSCAQRSGTGLAGTPQFSGDRPAPARECHHLTHPRGSQAVERWRKRAGIYQVAIEQTLAARRGDHPTAKPST